MAFVANRLGKLLSGTHRRLPSGRSLAGRSADVDAFFVEACPEGLRRGPLVLFGCRAFEFIPRPGEVDKLRSKLVLLPPGGSSHDPNMHCSVAILAQAVSAGLLGTCSDTLTPSLHWLPHQPQALALRAKVRSQIFFVTFSAQKSAMHGVLSS